MDFGLSCEQTSSTAQYLLPSQKRRRLDGSGGHTPLSPPYLSSPSCPSHETTPVPFLEFPPETTTGAISECTALEKHLPEGREKDDIWTDDHSYNRTLQNDTSCFGMLTDLRVRPYKNDIDALMQPITPVVVRKGRLSTQHPSNTDVGEVEWYIAQVLEKLEAQDGIELQSYLSSKTTELRRSSKPGQYILSVIVYGVKLQYEPVGAFLERCDLHLQDPRHCDRNVEYRNPQSLMQDISMTQEQDTEISEHIETFSNPVDLLADLENGEELSETGTPFCLRTELFSHQKKALTFMLRRERGWDFQGTNPDLWLATSCGGVTTYTNTVSGEVVHERPPEFCGGIIADQMGLGKSLSMIALIASDKNMTKSRPTYPTSLHGPRRTLLVVRAALLETWAHQLTLHVHPGRLRWILQYGKTRITNPSQLEGVDVVLTTYHCLMADWKKRGNRPQLMYETHWDRIILDEAHDIRDSNCVTSRALCALEATSRWAVTGTPIQNRLSDLGSLYKFLRIYPYQNARSFNELVQGLCNDHSPGMEKLKTFFGYIMLRRSISTVELPGRRDMLSKLDFSKDELEAYNRTKRQAHETLDDLATSSSLKGTSLNVLSLINKLLMICNLGTNAKLSNLVRTAELTSGQDDWDTLAAQNSFNSLVAAGSALCDGCSANLASVATEVADFTSGRKTQPVLSSCLYLICGPCLEKTDDHFECQHEPPCPSVHVSTLSSNIHINHEHYSTDDKSSTKIQALLQDLKKYLDDEKSVVFSFWTSTLDFIEAKLEQNGIKCVRIDGSVSKKKREAALKTFRENTSVRVALLTISCGAVGLDLTSASRAYLMEPHWNPSIDQQALARIHRMGQTRPVTTTRYVMRNSFEEHVLNIQSRKQALTDMLISTEKHGTNKLSSERIQVFRSCL